MEWILERIIYIVAVAICVLVIKFIVDRENRTKNKKEKGFLRILMICGNLIVFVLIVLCLRAGISYIGEGNTKAVLGLFLTAILLSLNLGSSIYRKLKK